MSVVLAVHNGARWLDVTITSVRRQTFTDWELVVVDDGSTDDTPNVVARHADDPRVRSLAQRRRERSAARNRGIAAGAGPLVAFLDADDLWLPTKLAHQVEAMAAHPEAGLCYTTAGFIDEAGQRRAGRKPLTPVAGHVLPRLMRGNVMILSSAMVRRRCLAEVGGFDEVLPVPGGEDWDLWLRIARRYPVVAVDQELTLYRRHGANTPTSTVLMSTLAVVDQHYRDPEMPRLTGLSRAAARARLLWYEAGALATSDPAAASRLARAALRESPRSLLDRPALGALAARWLPSAWVAGLQRVRGWS